MAGKPARVVIMVLLVAAVGGLRPAPPTRAAGTCFGEPVTISHTIDHKLTGCPGPSGSGVPQSTPAGARATIIARVQVPVAGRCQ